MFAEFNKITYCSDRVSCLINRYDNTEPALIDFLYEIKYWLYWDYKRQEIVRSKLDIKQSPNELMKLYVVRFSKDEDLKNEYIVKDYRGDKEWV